jgi:hypothetical protein
MRFSLAAKQPQARMLATQGHDRKPFVTVNQQFFGENS